MSPKFKADRFWSRYETPALVGIVNRSKDWRLLETEHWYRIPVRSAPPGLVAIRYLAFYRTRTLGADYWAVTRYARVRGITTVPRRELLPDEPTHPRRDDLYYRIAIGELQDLPRPIPSRCWRRIIFIPTTLERLLRAQEINDLFCTSPIEDRMHSNLKQAHFPAERQYLVRDGAVHYLLDFALFCRDGKLDLECDGEEYHSSRERAIADRSRDNLLTALGWRILRFGGREINQHPEQCLKMVKRTVRRLGGPLRPAQTGRSQ